MSFPEYASHDALGLAALVKKGEVSASELAEEAVSRIEKHNPALNAVILKLYDTGRAMAASPVDGPFKGVPFLLKDAFGDLKGTSTRLGSRFRADTPAMEDAVLTKRFKAAGLTILGKTNVPEYTLLPTTESKLYGAAHNPWNLDHTTGGSSGGAAARRCSTAPMAASRAILIARHPLSGPSSTRLDANPASCASPTA